MHYYPGPQTSANEPDGQVGFWHRTRPVADDQRTSVLFWLTVVGLGCLSLAAVTFGASAALSKKGGEKLLQVRLLLPKLNSSHGERKADPFRMSEAHPGEVAYPKDWRTAAPPHSLPMVVEGHDASVEHPGIHLATPEPPHALVELRVPARPSLVETCDDPVVYLQPCTPQRGDSPMIHNWKTLTLFSLLSAASVVYVPEPALAQDPPIKTEDPLAKRVKALEDKKSDYEALNKALQPQFKDLETAILKELKKSTDELNAEIATIKTNQVKHQTQLDTHKVQIEALMEQVRNLNKQILASGGSGQAPALDKASLEKIESRLNTIQDTLAKLGTEKRVALSMPSGTSNAGRVMLVNLYSDDLLFTVNGVGYRLPPRTSRMVENQPAGTLRYEVFSTRFGVLDNQVTTLTGGETYTVTATSSR